MSHIVLVCTACGRNHEPDMRNLGCEECGSPLDVAYREAGRYTIEWHGRRMPVPLHSSVLAVTMGEGHTPVVPLPAVGREIGLSSVFGKFEFMNPTGSFKDRGTAMMLSVAVEHSVTEVVEDSSGNAGASVSAYAARSDISAHVFAPSTAPDAKLGQIRIYEAQTHTVPGPREASTRAAVDFMRQRGLVYASHNLSPYFAEGMKSFAYEVEAQLSGTPDHIVIPVGNGSLVLGTWKGYSEIKAQSPGVLTPRLHAVQARAVMPIASAFSGVDWEPGGSTVAGGISVGGPPRKSQVLEALRETGGQALAVDEASIVRWQRLLASSEGVFCEPTSAAAFAGLETLVHDGHIGPDEVVVVPITGSGLKDAVPPSG